MHVAVFVASGGQGILPVTDVGANVALRDGGTVAFRSSARDWPVPSVHEADCFSGPPGPGPWDRAVRRRLRLE